jgi:DnaJ like chaperone protein
MRYLGKMLGFIAGWMLAGPFGALFGLVIGQYFDLSAAGYWSAPHRRYERTEHGFKREDAQKAFFRATFLVMGHIAKADGWVSEGEIQAARIIMRNMQLSAALKRDAIALFTQGKQSRFNLRESLETLIHACRGQRDVLSMFVDIQFQAAVTEGVIGPHKREILEQLCRQLGFNAMDFFIFNQRHHRHYHDSAQRRTRQQTGGGYRQPAYENVVVEDPYKILGITPKATDAEVKKAYRKLISANHPDKLVAKGLPEEMIKLANKKTAEIKKAYDTIAAARGIK